jgi:hypothetical protein
MSDGQTNVELDSAVSLASAPRRAARPGRAFVYAVLVVPVLLFVACPITLYTILNWVNAAPVTRMYCVAVAVGAIVASVHAFVWLAHAAVRCSKHFGDLCCCPWCSKALRKPAEQDLDVLESADDDELTLEAAWNESGIHTRNLPSQWRIIWIYAFTYVLWIGVAVLVTAVVGIWVAPFSNASKPPPPPPPQNPGPVTAAPFS